MDVFTIFGKVCELKSVDNGRYTRLTIVTNISFKTKAMRFNVWDQTLLQTKNSKLFEIGEEVEIKYTHKNSYLHLMEMSKTSIDICPVCYKYLEATDAQRTDCTACSLIPEEEHKTRVNAQMKLTSSVIKQYLHSPGYKLEFLHESENKRYVIVVFENSFLYNTIQNLKVGDCYFVIGWKSKQPGGFLDVVDIS